MDLVDEFRRVVEVANRADTLGQRRCFRGERDLALFVLHVDLERVEACRFQCDVLVELAWARDERHRHVDTLHGVR